MSAQPLARIPPLRPGDHLTPEEFLRRYEAMPELRKAELVEGVVYLPKDANHKDFEAPSFRLIGWLGIYRAHTAGVAGGAHACVKLIEGSTVTQPAVYLRVLAKYGGHCRIENGLVFGAPDLIAEVAASSASYDLHDKLQAYQRNGVREYVVWRTEDEAIDWFILKGGKFQRLTPGKDGVYKSKVFPGLWLDAKALLRGDLATVLTKAQEGIASAEHKKFVRKLGNK